MMSDRNSPAVSSPRTQRVILPQIQNCQDELASPTKPFALKNLTLQVNDDDTFDSNVAMDGANFRFSAKLPPLRGTRSHGDLPSIINSPASNDKLIFPRKAMTPNPRSEAMWSRQMISDSSSPRTHGEAFNIPRHRLAGLENFRRPISPADNIVHFKSRKDLLKASLSPKVVLECCNTVDAETVAIQVASSFDFNEQQFRSENHPTEEELLQIPPTDQIASRFSKLSYME